MARAAARGLLLAGAAALLAAAACARKAAGGYPSLNPSRDFSLTDQDGREYHLKDSRGGPVLLFFGYLSCPDVCPATLSKVSRAARLLGPRGKDLLTLFVTVDPARDTPAKLKAYLGYFGIRALGLTGSKARIDAVVKAYGASYRLYPPSADGSYRVDHSDILYLIGPEGEVRALFHQQDGADAVAAAVRRLD